MLKVLLPVDGSDTSNQTVVGFIQSLDGYKEIPEIHLLNVQLPVHGNIALFIDAQNIKQYHQDEGMKALKTPRKLVQQAKIACQFHIIVGDPAEMIVEFAKERVFDQIVIGPRGMGTIKNLLLGSVASKVVQLSPIPVLLVK